MAAATEGRLSTRHKSNAGDRYYDRTAGGTIYPGTLAALGATAAAATAAGARVAGVCLGVTGKDGVTVTAGDKAHISEGVFGPFAQSGIAITTTDIGEPAFVVDDQTVSIAAGACCAGIIVDVDDDGVWLFVSLATNGAVDARNLA